MKFSTLGLVQFPGRHLPVGFLLGHSGRRQLAAVSTGGTRFILFEVKVRPKECVFRWVKGYTNEGVANIVER